MGVAPHARAGDAPEHAEWRLLSGPVDPPQMSGHAAIRDPLRHRMVLVDPGRPQELWTLSLPASGPPAWVRVAVEGAVFPAWRTLSSAVLDPSRDRVLVFGGFQSGTSSNEVWALSLGARPRWTPIVPDGTPPAPRAQSAAIYDPVRDRMLVFGGVSNAGYEGEEIYSDTWSLELADRPRWVQLQPPGTIPGRRKGASAVYDAAGDRMLVFGGWTQVPATPPYSGLTYTASNETWGLYLSGSPRWWRLPISVVPPGRQETIAIADPASDRMIVSGGNSWQWSRFLGDTWTLPLDAWISGAAANWTRLAIVGASPEVSRHAAIFSPERGSLLQYGGDNAGNVCSELDLASGTWSRLDAEVSGPFPSRRMQPTLIADPVIRSLRLFGGGWGCQHDLWEFPLQGPAAWTPLPTVGTAPACRDPNFVIDPPRRRLLCITGGSVSGRGTLSEVWTLPFAEPRVWTKLVTNGPNPPPRFQYGLVFDSARDRVLLFGGATWQTRAGNQADDRDDVWELSLGDLTWKQLFPVNSPGARNRASVHYDSVGDRLLVVGGATSGYRSRFARYDCWALDLGGDSLRWARFAPDVPARPISPFDAPEQRVVWDPLRNRMVLWDGAGLGWTLSLDHPDEWRALELFGDQPTPRDYFGLTYDAGGDQLIVFGGDDGSLKADLLALRFSDEVRVLRMERGNDGGGMPRAGLFEAAILGSATFSVDSVLVGTVTLGGAPVFSPGPHDGLAQRRDVNGDRYEDLVLKFRAESLRVAPRDTVLLLLGSTPHFGIRGTATLERPPLRRPRAEPAGIVSGPGTLALASVSPSRTRIKMRYSLEGGWPARIEVFDITGRRVQTRDLPGYEAGEHLLELGPGLEPGLYMIRLRQKEREVQARVILLP